MKTKNYYKYYIGFISKMTEDLQEFIENIVKSYEWDFIGEMIYKAYMQNYISIECTDLEKLQFEIKEYTTDKAIGVCMYDAYSKSEYIQRYPPYSIESINEYEKKYNIKLPRLTRIFATYVSSAIFNLEKAPLYTYIDPERSFNYGVFDFDEITVYYDDDEVKDPDCNSRIINIFYGRNEFLSCVVDGYEKGRIFNESCSSALGSTETEIDFFLNSITPIRFKHIRSIIQNLFPIIIKEVK